MPHDLSLMLRASETGRPITGLTDAAVAAAFGTDVSVVRFAEVQQQPGREGGPGWLEVHLTPDADQRRRTAPTEAEKWQDTIGGDRGAIPGSVFVKKVRDRERKVTHYIAQAPDEMGEPRVNQHALAAALKTKYDEGRLFVTIDGSQILVSLWDSSPLAQVFPATRELLKPDKDGRWVTGFLGNGQPARNRVYTDRGAAHGLFVAPSGGGKTQLMGLHVAADALFGAVVMLATEAPDEKTAALGKHTARYGVGALYMIRLLRVLVALMEIRGEMPWEDGQVHEWDPTRPGCPYRMLSAYLDEFLSAARNGEYGAEIMDLAESVSVKGRKYGVGLKVAGQSIYVQDGFTQLLCENLRENCIPVVLKVAPQKVTDMFKALGISVRVHSRPAPPLLLRRGGGPDRAGDARRARAARRLQHRRRRMDRRSQAARGPAHAVHGLHGRHRRLLPRHRPEPHRPRDPRARRRGTCGSTGTSRPGPASSAPNPTTKTRTRTPLPVPAAAARPRPRADATPSPPPARRWKQSSTSTTPDPPSPLLHDAEGRRRRTIPAAPFGAPCLETRCLTPLPPPPQTGPPDPRRPPPRSRPPPP